MRKCCVTVAVFCVATMGAGLMRAQTTHESVVVKLDPALDEIVSPDAPLTPVTSGFGFTEGLTWKQEGNTGYLLFSDIAANVINKMTPDGKVSAVVEQSGYHGPWTGDRLMTVGHPQNNGKDPKDPQFRQFIMIGADGVNLDPQGRIVFCTFTGRSVDRIEKDGKRVVLADRYEGKILNGPNDLTVKRSGTIYFTDTFTDRLREKDPRTELPYMAVYMIKDGKAIQVIKDDDQSPNGIALSPDEKILYVTAPGSTIRQYDVQPDDTVTNGRLLIDMSSDKSGPGGPDGVRVDSKGNIWSSGPRGVWIISPQGKHLGTILVPERFASFGLGNPDYKTLYIGGRTTIYKIPVKVAGKHF
jgi:gluconolactonase